MNSYVPACLSVSTTAFAGAKPFVKWVGGKRQLLPELTKRLPKTIVHYFEPFIGGGALLWTLDKSAIQSITINDYNSELINLYRVVRDTPIELINDLAYHVNDEAYFYWIRAQDRQSGFELLSPVLRASRFLFLNKTCFNGLYRVNKKGFFNSPFGRYEKPNIIDSPTLLACSSFLQSVQILNMDFDSLRGLYNKDSFVYFDPPYVPVSASSNFTSYTDAKFDYSMQERLKACCDHIHAVGGKFMLSNSCTPFVRELWADYSIDTVEASRAINCKADGRGKIAEVIIRNYTN